MRCRRSLYLKVPPGYAECDSEKLAEILTLKMGEKFAQRPKTLQNLQFLTHFSPEVPLQI